MRRKAKHSIINSGKGLLFLLLFGLLVPTNYMGNIIKAQKISNTSFVKDHNEDGSVPDTSTNEEEREGEGVGGKSHFKIKVYFTTWIAFILVASTVILLTILAYLNNQPLYRECLLLYLYQDVLKLFLAKAWFLSSVAMIYKVHGYGTVIENYHAKILSYAVVASNVALLLALNASSFLKLFIKKSKTLDPIETFYGCGDRNALLKIRLFISIFVAALIVFMYTNDFTGSQYYFLVEDNRYQKDMPTGTVIIQALNVLLFIAFAISHILQMFYVQIEGIKEACQRMFCAQNIIFENVETGQDFENSTADTDDTQDADSGFGTEFSWTPARSIFICPTPLTSKRHAKKLLAYSVFLTPALVIGMWYVLVFMVDFVRKTDWWNFILMAETIEGIILPLWLISTNGHLRVHVKRRLDLVLTPLIERLQMMFICRKLKKKSSKVEPLV